MKGHDCPGRGEGATDVFKSVISGPLLVLPYKQAKLQFEKSYIEQAMAHSGGSLKLTARSTGIAFNTLRRMIKRVGYTTEKDAADTFKSTASPLKILRRAVRATYARFAKYAQYADYAEYAEFAMVANRECKATDFKQFAKKEKKKSCHRIELN